LSFGGLLVPAKTPTEVVATLESACDTAIKSAAYKSYAERANQVIDYLPSSAFEKRLRQDSVTKAATLKRLGL